MNRVLTNQLEDHISPVKGQKLQQIDTLCDTDDAINEIDRYFAYKMFDKENILHKQQSIKMNTANNQIALYVNTYRILYLIPCVLLNVISI